VIDLLQESRWLYPMVQVVHILGFIVLVGGAILFDLRVLGLSSTRATQDAGTQVAIRPLGMHLLPWSAIAAMAVVPTGVLMFLVDLQALIDNRAFVIKLMLIACAAGNAVAFHLGTGRNWTAWTDERSVPAGAKWHAAASICLWIAIVTCGRWIAYT